MAEMLKLQPGLNDVTNEAPPGGTEQPDIGITVDSIDPKIGPNVYIIKRNIIHQMIDVALLMANVSQLKTLLDIDSQDKYFYLLVTFISLSITLQVIFTVCMLVAWTTEKKQNGVEQLPAASGLDEVDGARRKRVDILDRLGDFLVLMIIVLNVFITGFGVEPHD